MSDFLLYIFLLFGIFVFFAGLLLLRTITRIAKKPPTQADFVEGGMVREIGPDGEPTGNVVQQYKLSQRYIDQLYW